jgi:hypothetical protein
MLFNLYLLYENSPAIETSKQYDYLTNSLFTCEKVCDKIINIINKIESFFKNEKNLNHKNIGSNMREEIIKRLKYLNKYKKYAEDLLKNIKDYTLYLKENKEPIIAHKKDILIACILFSSNILHLCNILFINFLYDINLITTKLNFNTAKINKFVNILTKLYDILNQFQLTTENFFDKNIINYNLNLNSQCIDRLLENNFFDLAKFDIKNSIFLKEYEKIHKAIDEKINLCKNKNLSIFIKNLNNKKDEILLAINELLVFKSYKQEQKLELKYLIFKYFTQQSLKILKSYYLILPFDFLKNINNIDFLSKMSEENFKTYIKEFNTISMSLQSLNLESLSLIKSLEEQLKALEII